MFQIFALKQPIDQNRVVLLKEKYWNVLKACIYLYIERVIPMNFMCINSDETGKKAYKLCQNAKFGLSLLKVWMMNYKVQMLNAITTLLISLIQKGMPESRLFSAV